MYLTEYGLRLKSQLTKPCLLCEVECTISTGCKCGNCLVMLQPEYSVNGHCFCSLQNCSWSDF